MFSLYQFYYGWLIKFFKNAKTFVHVYDGCLCNCQDMPHGIAFSLQDYCELVDTTGRIIRADKAGAIDSAQNPILSRLGLSEEQWITLTTEFEQHFCYAAGAEQMMQEFKTHTHRKRIGGMKQAKRLLS